MLDINLARNELTALKLAITHRGDNPATIEAIKAEALLDIAESLRTMLTPVEYTELDTTTTTTAEGDEVIVEPPLEVGDWAVSIMDAITEYDEPHEVIAVSEREGDPCIDLGNGWVYAVHFRRATEDEARSHQRADDDEPTGADMVDEIDDDFDGDPAPVLPDAFTVLKGKGAKKGKTK